MVDAEDLYDSAAGGASDHMGFFDSGIVHDGDDVARHVFHAVDAGRLRARAGAPVIVEDDGSFLREGLPPVAARTSARRSAR